MIAYREADGRELKRVNEQEIARLQASTQGHGIPQVYCPGKFYYDTQDRVVSRIQVWPGVAVDTDIVVSKYIMVTPTLVDATDETNGLTQIPTRYQRNVIKEYAKSKVMFDEGDTRDKEVMQAVMDAVLRGWRDEVPQNYAQKPRRYGHGRR
jgi:hypothetical protein